jgi:ubiquitin-protein ligase
VEQAILSVISMLSDPNFDDPANAEAKALFESNPATYKQTVLAYV